MRLSQLQQRLAPLVERYQTINPQRNSALFLTMLPTGYDCTTICKLSAEKHHELIYTKVCLGMLITLYDDYADNPTMANPTLLQQLYKLPQQSTLTTFSNNPAIALAQTLHQQVSDYIDQHKHVLNYAPIYAFDLDQFYQCNRYCELINQQPELANLNEFKALAPYNMGMVVAGMLDLISCRQFASQELGQLRELFVLGQRYGCLCNTLTTMNREIKERDMTNEVLLTALHQNRITIESLNCMDPSSIQHCLEPIQHRLKQEQNELLTHMHNQYHQLTSIKVTHYLSGLQQLNEIHHRLVEVI